MLLKDIPKLYMTIGCARSGKTTFAKKWEREISNTPRIAVTTDTIRLAMTNERYNRHLEPVIFSHRHVMAKTLLLDGKEVLMVGTNTTRRSLMDVLSLDKNAQPIVFDTPLDICLDRAIQTKMPDLIPVIKRHHKQLQELLSYGLDRTLDEIRNELEYRWKK